MLLASGQIKSLYTIFIFLVCINLDCFKLEKRTILTCLKWTRKRPNINSLGLQITLIDRIIGVDINIQILIFRFLIDKILARRVHESRRCYSNGAILKLDLNTFKMIKPFKNVHVTEKRSASTYWQWRVTFGKGFFFD